MKEEARIEPRLWNIKQVADYIGLAEDTLYAMVSQRRIPFVKVGRLTKFDRGAIDAWLDRNTVKPRCA
jgi:excisionase family DNA binding protein